MKVPRRMDADARLRTRCRFLSALAVVVGFVLLFDSLWKSSATYDEVAYLKVACRWWRTGDQESMTRMGSPLTFWKLQQAPVLLGLDPSGRGEWIDDPIRHQAQLLPLVRLGGLWIWLAAIGLTLFWAGRLHGPRAMALAAWVFALEPNLLAHGGLVTMEMPIVAGSALVGLLFWTFLRTGNRRWLWASGLACGLAFSCKFTAIVFPAILGLAWWLSPSETQAGGRCPPYKIFRVAGGMSVFVGLMLLGDVVLTGFATQTPSESRGGHPAIESRLPIAIQPAVASLIETPLPADLVAFVIQVRHQRSGGPSFLMGERRLRGWWYYYLVAMAIKVPLGFWLLFGGRCLVGPKIARDRQEGMILVLLGAYLAIASIGSTRNYGIRYLLPMAPMAVVWISGLAEGSRRARTLAVVGLLGMVASLAMIHPHELTYFNVLGGGRDGGRRILSDSNLDWGQGARSLARLQAKHPELRDLTFYAFGDTDPGWYGVSGRCIVVDAGEEQPDLPDHFRASTRYVAVSSSLLWGPWGPPDYFEFLRSVRPLVWTDDGTIAVFRSKDVREAR
ncbi:MAG TPA: glycosyltransferase family 39 protein [Isosphaeraceae bacterium]|nr:glycosyltransferase family 39 protein [Isosphaeraceae bacterium]